MSPSNMKMLHIGLAVLIAALLAAIVVLVVMLVKAKNCDSQHSEDDRNNESGMKNLEDKHEQCTELLREQSKKIQDLQRQLGDNSAGVRDDVGESYNLLMHDNTYGDKNSNSLPVVMNPNERSKQHKSQHSQSSEKDPHKNYKDDSKLKHMGKVLVVMGNTEQCGYCQLLKDELEDYSNKIVYYDISDDSFEEMYQRAPEGIKSKFQEDVENETGIPASYVYNTSKDSVEKSIIGAEIDTLKKELHAI